MKNERKEELKDEMKNRISLALKDPILQQGFECICKENAELKETVIKMNNVITETFSNLSKAKELLERLLITSCNSDVLNLLPNCSEVLRVRTEAEQFLDDEGYARTLQTIQLSKAKELLKEFIFLLHNPRTALDTKTVINKAEQFLNGEGCPDCLCKDCTKDCGIKKFGLVEVEK